MSSHRAPLLWDNHVYLPEDPGTAAIEQLERHRRLGFNVVMLNIGDADCTLESIVRMAAFARRWLREHDDRFLLIENLSDIDRARREGKLAVGFNVEGLYALGDRTDVLSLFRDLGVRWVLMVYNRRNGVGSGVHDDIDEGLSDLGRRAVAEMDDLGIVKCLSHTGHRTARDVLAMSRRPCIFSHSNAAAIWPHARNIPDDLIRACAATGGVVGINGIALFLGEGPATALRMADHIDHVAQLVGVAHVGIGSDYGYQVPGHIGGAIPTESFFWPAGNGYGERRDHGVIEPEELPELFDILARRGYGEADLAAIQGGNLLRVAGQVWTDLR